MLKISTAPHMSSSVDTSVIMRDVIIALLPAVLVSLLFFGLSAVVVLLTSVAACMLCEYAICRWLLHKQSTLRDGSAAVTGLLLAFNLPAGFPVWMILIGAFVAVGISKMAFGGLGKNLFNPALVGRVFLFVSFPLQMTTWPRPKFLDFFNTDVQTGATTLGILKHLDAETSATALTKYSTSIQDIPNYWQMFVGYTGGCLGEVSAAALLLGLCYLLWRKVISWHIPFYYLATVFIFTSALWLLYESPVYDPVTHLLSGGLILGAVFMATDYVTSPMSVNGKIIFAVGCGLLTVIIRLFGAYPEGVSFDILIMNAFVPLIDRFVRPRVFGTGRK